MDAKCTKLVVAMVPWNDEAGDEDKDEEDMQYKEGDEFFVVEKLGLEMASMAGASEEADKED